MEEKKRLKGQDFGALIISILIAEGIGFIAGAFTRGSLQYYKALNKPTFAPPSWIFGVVWPVLYFLMAIAAYRIWKKKEEGAFVENALIFYVMQLILNFFWPFIFFRLNLYGIAFMELVILLVVVIITTIKFFKIDKLSGVFMIPYIIWLLYASVLNYFIWLLNEA